MTESESDANSPHPLDVRRRVLEILYNNDETFTVSQLARIIGVDEPLITRELERQSDVQFDPRERTARVRKLGSISSPVTRQGQWSAAFYAKGISTGAGPGGDVTSSGRGIPTYSYGSVRNTGYGGIGPSSLRKPKHRRPIGHSTDIRSSLADGSAGRVGYVCVAEGFALDGLEGYYRDKKYYTKFDYDVLHIRFSEAELLKESVVSGISPFSSTQMAEDGDIPLAELAEKAVADGSMGKGTAKGLMGPSVGENVGAAAYHSKAGFDLFVFQYGAVVWWGFDQRFFKIVEHDFMYPNSPITKFMVNRYKTPLVTDNYPVWCTYSLVKKETLEPDEDFKERLQFDHFLIPFGRGDIDTCSISMLCASHALAQSAKIDYLELKVQELTQSCMPLPREMREHGKVTISERRLLQLRGEVLSYRLMLKSGSDLLDEPEFFWQNAFLKPVFQATKECFEIAERVEALDTKLDADNEILSMIADEFSHRHGARLEWIVIWLVFAEVVVGLLELFIDVKPWFTRH